MGSPALDQGELRLMVVIPGLEADRRQLLGGSIQRVGNRLFLLPHESGGRLLPRMLVDR
jgi:hypothetical protein